MDINSGNDRVRMNCTKAKKTGKNEKHNNNNEILSQKYNSVMSPRVKRRLLWPEEIKCINTIKLYSDHTNKFQSSYKS